MSPSKRGNPGSVQSSRPHHASGLALMFGSAESAASRSGRGAETSEIRRRSMVSIALRDVDERAILSSGDQTRPSLEGNREGVRGLRELADSLANKMVRGARETARRNNARSS